MALGPFTALGDAANEITHYVGSLANQFLGDHQYAGNEMRPNIFCMVEDAAAAGEFGFGCMWLTHEIGIDGFSSQCSRHVLPRQFHEPDLVGFHTLVVHKFANHEVLIPILAGYVASI